MNHWHVNDAAGPPSANSFASWPHFNEEMIEAAASVLRSGRVNYWTGSEGRQFEREFADYVGCRHAVAVANGTAALELALWALDIGPGDEVVVPSRTFVATASAVVRCGATPVFADVDFITQNIAAESIRECLTPNTRAVIAVHLAGWPCDMDPIIELARTHKLAVIEDCAQAHGARYKGRAVGSIGDAGAYSFCQDKIMTTGGEGGMLATNRRDVWQRAWSLKDHGKSYDAVHNRSHPPGFRWLHERIGTNWRLTEIQSAVGRVCLRKLDAWVAARRSNAASLSKCFSGIPALRTTVPEADFFHSYYKYYTFVRSDQLGADWNRDRILAEINAAGVPCFAGSCSEVYLEEAFDPGMRPSERLPVAKQLGETSLMFPVHPALGDQEMQQASRSILEILQRARDQGMRARSVISAA